MNVHVRALCFLVAYWVCGCGFVIADSFEEKRAGYLFSQQENGDRRSIPIKSAWVGVDLSPGIIETTISQVFSNNTEDALECTYLYPLPEDATIVTMELRYDDRVVSSVVQEKAEAKATYEAAKSAGKKAALVERYRANLFSSSVANFLPGETVEVRFSYVQELKLGDGGFQYRLPIVAEKRYFPKAPEPSPDTLIEAAVEVASGAVDSLRNVVRKSESVALSGSDFSLMIDLSSIGIPIGKMYSKSHHVEGVSLDGESGEWALSSKFSGADLGRDFVLEIEFGQQASLTPTLVTAKSESGLYGSLTLFPPDSDDGLIGDPHGRDVIFLVDHSGSMNGDRMVSAREGIAKCLMELQEKDRFNIVIFDDEFEFYSSDFVDATAEALAQGIVFARSIEAEGGTEMQPALKASLESFDDASFNERLIVFLTDGAVGNEAELIGLLERQLGKARLFTFGIGTAPNEFLVKQMAAAGRGQARFIMDDKEVDEEIRDLFKVLDTPVLKDVELSFYDDLGQVIEVDALPYPIANVYAGYPVQVVFRSEERVPAFARLSGFRGGEREVIDVDLPKEYRGPKSLATLFGQKWIDSLLLELYAANDVETRSAIEKEIVEVSVLFQLVTEYTSRVAVEQTVTRIPTQALRSYASVARPTVSGAKSYSTASGGGSGDVFELSPFSVEASSDTGYKASSTLAGSRLRTSLKDVGSAMSVITEEFLEDIGATDKESVLSYASSTEVGGLAGCFAGTRTSLQTNDGVSGLRGFAAIDPLALARVDVPATPASAVSSELNIRGGNSFWEKGAGYSESGEFGIRVGDQDYSAVWFEANKMLSDDRLAANVFAARTKREVESDTIRLGAHWDPDTHVRLNMRYGIDEYEGYMKDEHFAGGFSLSGEANPDLFRYEIHWSNTEVEDPYAFGVDRAGSLLSDQLAADELYPLSHVREQSEFIHGVSSSVEFDTALFNQSVYVFGGERTSEVDMEFWASDREIVNLDRDTEEMALFYLLRDGERRFNLSLSLRNFDHEWKDSDRTASDFAWSSAFTVTTNEWFSFTARYAEDQTTPGITTCGLVFDSSESKWGVAPELTDEASRGLDLFARVGSPDNRVNLEVGYFKRVDFGELYRDWGEEYALATWYGEMGIDRGVDVVLRNSPRTVKEGAAIRVHVEPTRRLSLIGWYLEDFKDESFVIRGGNRRAALAGRWIAWDGSWDRLILGGGLRYRNDILFLDGFEMAGGVTSDVFVRYEFGERSSRSVQLNLRNLGGDATRSSRYSADLGAETLLSFRQEF